MSRPDRPTIYHFANTLKKHKQRMPLCGYCPDEDEMAVDPSGVNCEECLDWMRPPSQDSAHTQEGQQK